MESNVASSANVRTHYFDADSAGLQAIRVINVINNAYVLAVFDRCIYIEQPHATTTDKTTLSSQHNEPSLVCIGGPAFSPGPIHIIVDKSCQSLIASMVNAGDYVEGDGSSLILHCGAEKLHIDTVNATCYDSKRSTSVSSGFPLKRDVHATSRNIGMLRPYHREIVDRQVISRQAVRGSELGNISARSVFEAPGLDTPAMSVHARPALIALQNYFLRPPDENTLETIASLVGMGLGLTPAGDDVLSGYLAAVGNLCGTHLTDENQKLLRRRVLDNVFTGTSRISGAHLMCSINNDYTQEVAQIIEVLTNDQPPHPHTLRKVSTILKGVGATSGDDWLAGFDLGTHALKKVV